MGKFAAPFMINIAVLFGLGGCNGVGESFQTSLPSDGTIPVVVPTPAPTVTPTPSPTPTSTGTPTGQLYTGPAEMEKYVMKFVDDAKRQGLDLVPKMASPLLNIKVASLDSYGSSVIGLCETGGKSRTVTFDPDFWNSVSETQRELLAHHEMGHCILYRGHRSEVLSTGKYASIMYPIIMSTSTYTADYEFYQNELFTWNVAAALAEADPEQVQVHICDH